jgi:hypothetical protein
MIGEIDSDTTSAFIKFFSQEDTSAFFNFLSRQEPSPPSCNAEAAEIGLFRADNLHPLAGF